MKKRKLIKILKQTIREIEEETAAKPSLNKTHSNDFSFTETSEDSKKKIRDLIFRICEKPNEFDYRINDYNISIYPIDKPNKVTQHPSYFSIEIIKDVGYNINCDVKRSTIQDITLYDEVFDLIKSTFDKINTDNLNDLYSTIMSEHGLIRQKNLDDLLQNQT